MAQLPEPRTADYGAEAETDLSVAFSAFHASYARRVRAYVGEAFPRCDVDAVVQDTFRRAYAHFGELVRSANPWPWLATVARNLARNQARDDVRDADVVCLHQIENLPDPAAEPESRLLQLEQMHILGRAMQVLPDRQRQLVQLMILDGMTPTEAGEALGLQAANARQQLHRMRTRLKKEFVALGGRLGLVPILAAFRWSRRHASRLPAYSWSTATLAAATLGVATATLVLQTPSVDHFSTWAHPAAASHHEPEASAHRATAAHGHAAAPHHAAVATAAPKAHVAPTSNVATGAPPVTAVKHIAKHPLRDGAENHVGLWVDTPVGRYGVGDDAIQHDEATACHVANPLC